MLCSASRNHSSRFTTSQVSPRHWIGPAFYALYRRRDIELKLPSPTSCLAFPFSLATAVRMNSIDNRVGGSRLSFGLGGRHKCSGLGYFSPI